MIWMYIWPVGTSGGMVMVAEPVLVMFSARVMPSPGVILPEVWSLRVMVLEGGKRGEVSDGKGACWGSFGSWD